MKNNDSKKPARQSKERPGFLAARATEAEKQAEVARKLARLAKAKFKEARKAYKQAKKFAKLARKEAKAASKELKKRVRTRTRKVAVKKAVASEPGKPPPQLTAPSASSLRPAKRLKVVMPVPPAHENGPPIPPGGQDIAQS